MFCLSNSTLPCINRRNDVTYWVSFDYKSFAKGRNYKVYSGIINGKGPLSRNRCAVKVFRRTVGTERLCICEIKKNEIATKLARDFNHLPSTRNTRVKFAELYYAEMDEVSTIKKIFYSGRKRLSSKDFILFEVDIRFDDEVSLHKNRELTLFMDHKGRNEICEAKDLEAFAHFTYHTTNGELVICDLDGVEDERGFFLKTPVVHSKAKEFGKSDLGFDGIKAFFSNHVCNQLCKDMAKPLDNLPACNRIYQPATNGCDAFTSSTLGQRTSENVNKNNNSSHLNNEVPANSHSMNGNYFEQRYFGQGTNVLPGYLEPSAPFSEDFNNQMIQPLNDTNASVLHWILQEQLRNSFIQPYWQNMEPVVVVPCDRKMSIDSGKGESISSSLAKDSNSFLN